MEFNINDKVVCIIPTGQDWYCTKTHKILYGPKTNEILVIDKIIYNDYFVFSKYKLTHSWISFAFRKLDYDFAEEVMRNIIEQPIEVLQL